MASTTQIIKLNPGETIVLPSDAVIISVTEFAGGSATSDCALPPSQGTVTYYFYIDENPAENGTEAFFFEKLIVGGSISLFPFGYRPATVDVDTDPTFINVIKSNPAVLELRTKNYGGTDNKAFSITVPAGTPEPYFYSYLTNSSSPWYVRLYQITSTDAHYASSVADLDASTIR